MEYDRVLVVFNIILSSEQMEIAEDCQWRASLAKKLIDASGWEFGCLLSQIGTETVDTSTGAVVSIIHESMVDVRTKRGGEKGREVPRSLVTINVDVGKLEIDVVKGCNEMLESNWGGSAKVWVSRCNA